MPSSGVQTCARSEEHTSELQSHDNLVCRLLLEKKKFSKTRCPLPNRHVCVVARATTPLRDWTQFGRTPSLAIKGPRPIMPVLISFFLNNRAPPESTPLPPPAPFHS